MRKRRVLLIGIAVTIVAIMGLVMVLTRSREPEYGGKKLSEWVREYHPAAATGARSFQSPETDEAIRRIGSAAVPYLLKWIGYEPPAWEIKLADEVNPILKHISPARQVTFGMNAKWRLAQGSAAALIALGPNAECTIGDLARMLNEPPTGVVTRRAELVLSHLGPLLPLAQFLTDGDANARFRLQVIHDAMMLRSNTLTKIDPVGLEKTTH